MHKCSFCKKYVGNGVMAFVNGCKVTLCPSCLQWATGSGVEQVRQAIKTGKKSGENGEIPMGYNWAAFWTPDCEDVKTKIKARKAKGAKK